MKTLAVGELKTHFSEVLEEVKTGAEIIITYGRKRKYRSNNSVCQLSEEK